MVVKSPIFDLLILNNTPIRVWNWSVRFIGLRYQLGVIYDWAPWGVSLSCRWRHPHIVWQGQKLELWEAMGGPPPWISKFTRAKLQVVQVEGGTYVASNNSHYTHKLKKYFCTLHYTHNLNNFFGHYTYKFSKISAQKLKKYFCTLHTEFEQFFCTLHTQVQQD